MDRASWAMRIAIIGLFAIYLTPLIGLTIAYVGTGAFASKNGMLIAFDGFTAAGDDSLATVHRTLLPLMGGMAPVAFKDDSTARWSVGLMLGLLAGIALSIFFDALFHSESTIQRLSQSELFGLSAPDADMTPVQLSLAVKTLQPVFSFFNRTQEVMAMYLLMLFGLTLAKKV